MDLAKSYDLNVLTVDLDINPLIKGQFLVFSAPTVLVIYEKREVLRTSRFVDLNKINKSIDALTKG